MKFIYTLLISLSLFQFSQAQCLDDRHSPFEEQGWLSCNTSQNPISQRGESHWIAYDFGDTYIVDSLTIWNHNVWSETGLGAKEIMVDYSVNNMDWISAGPYEIEQAPGSWKYAGTEGPSLGNVPARYVVITVLKTWDGTQNCAGIGEIKFSVGQIVNTDEPEIADLWSITPNPAKDQITIQLPISNVVERLTLYNNLGVLIRELALPAGSTAIIPINDLTDGVYHIAYQTEEGLDTKSFMKVE